MYWAQWLLLVLFVLINSYQAYEAHGKRVAKKASDAAWELGFWEDWFLRTCTWTLLVLAGAFNQIIGWPR